MSTLPPLSQFPPLNRPPPSSYWPIRGSTSQTKHASATHQSKFLAAEIEALSDEETQFEAAVGVFVFVNRNEADKRPPKWQHIRMRNWGSKHLKPAGRTTTWDEDEDDAAGVVDESSPAINNPLMNASSPAETEVAPTHANYLGAQSGQDSDEDDVGMSSPVRDLDDDVESYGERSFVNQNTTYESESDEEQEEGGEEQSESEGNHSL